MNIINIAKRRELFWDDYLLDAKKTTAKSRVNHPIACGTKFMFDKPWEARTISYPHIVKVDDTYRLYYIPYRDINVPRLAVIESKDGKNWERPEVNAYEYDGSYENNILYKVNDNCCVFYDQNPACPPEEKFKGLMSEPQKREDGTSSCVRLRCITSPDGYHFKQGKLLNVEGAFDSLNTAQWVDGQYVLYYRDYIDDNRVVRVAYSKDFENWTGFEAIKFDSDKIFQLYTNNVIQYERAPHMYIGWPTRYTERKGWTPNLKQLTSYPVKKEASADGDPINSTERATLAVTDSMFMCSRDGKNWHRYDEAFMTPGFENEHNWVYGDCYLTWNMVDVGDENYYLYTIDCHLDKSFDVQPPLNMWKIRKDGFAFYEAGGEDAFIVTKPLTFAGEYLHLNFETSGSGSIYVDLLDADGNEIPGKTSFELYGNTIDRKVFFEDGSNFGEYAGKPVRLRFRMVDAKIYSMKFE